MMIHGLGKFHDKPTKKPRRNEAFNLPAESPGVGHSAISELRVQISRCLLATSVVMLASVGEFDTLFLNSSVMRDVGMASVDESCHRWFLEASSGPRSLA